MEIRNPKPTHASYRAHRKQVTWQIVAPVILASLLILAATVLVALAAGRGTGDVGRWAAISTIWLLIPVLFGGLILLAIVAALAILTGLAQDFIPPYSWKAQVFVSQVRSGIQRGAAIAYRPKLILPLLRELMRNGIRRLQRG